MMTHWIQKETIWKTCTEEGNTLFSEGEYRNALEQYVRALELATELLDVHAYVNAGIPVVPLYVISCNNLGNTHWEMGGLEKADFYFLRPLYAIKTITQNPATRDTMRYSALREVTRITITYLDFCRKTGRRGRFSPATAEHLGLSLQAISPN